MEQVRLKGAYAKINLDNIVHNYREAKKKVGKNVTVSCVVKSDAYGHGETEVIKALVEDGLKIICVSTMIEAVRLRPQFLELDILVLGYTPQFLANKAHEQNIIQTISTIEEANTLNAIGKTKVHIKVNSGMNRLGFEPSEAELIKEISKMENIEICGIFTHMHSSDSANKESAYLQYSKFKALTESLEALGVVLGIKHVCNSGGIIDLPDFYEDMVREGIMLYGMYPSKAVSRKDVFLKECMEFISYIASISWVKKGQGISYGHTFFAPDDMKVATINLGYSDGVFRLLSNVGQVIIRDTRCPIVGRVCMNMFMVDVTRLKDVEVEDPVIVFGRSEHQFISIDQVADQCQTISYEITCRTGYSVPRVYYKNGKIVKVEQDLLIES